jgi:hypothetical protein
MSVDSLSPLDLIAMKNTMLLSKNRDNPNFQWYVEGPEIKTMGTENPYESVNTLSDLEYPLLFTFHHLFRFVDDPNRLRFKDHSKKDILLLMDHLIESCYRIVNQVGYLSEDIPESSDEKEEEKEEAEEAEVVKESEQDLSRYRVLCLLQEFDDKHSCAYERFRSQSLCDVVSHWIEETFDEFVVACSECHQYVYTYCEFQREHDSDSWSKKEFQEWKTHFPDGMSSGSDESQEEEDKVKDE